MCPEIERLRAYPPSTAPSDLSSTYRQIFVTGITGSTSPMRFSLPPPIEVSTKCLWFLYRPERVKLKNFFAVFL
jgi:hypothetical protein